VPGCKWWYCAEPASYGRAAAVSAASHPGYSVEEVDNLPYKEQMALAPQMGRYFGSYTTKSEKPPPPPPPAGPSREQLEQQAREFVPAEVAAKAAARNLGVRVQPFVTREQPSSTEEYYDLALQSLHAIPRHMEQAMQRVKVSFKPHGRRTVEISHGSVTGDPPRYYERLVRGRPLQTLRRNYSRPQRSGAPPQRYGVMVQRPQVMPAPAAGGARKQQLAELGGGGGSMISAIKRGGQAYVDELEAQLTDAQVGFRI
jgi:hypothetical protein